MNSSIKISTQYDSKEDQLVNQIREENSLYVIIGSNNGSLFNKLKNLPPIDGTRYVVIEPNKIYLDLLNNSPLENSERVYFGNASNWKQILIHLKADNYLYSNQLFLKKYQSNDPEVQQKYNDLNIDVENTILTYAKGLLIQANRIPYIKNILVNLPDLILPAKILEGKGKGTALVVGAGPSLDDHLHWIKEHKNKLTIICISRVYAQLKKEDIDPDIIVSVDPQDVNYEQSKSILLEEKSILVHSNYVAPKLLAQWKGPKLYLENLFPWEHKKNIPNLQVGSPTVAHSAISLAIDMQFDQILLVGVDLCYWHESKTHSGNINLDKNAQDHDFNEVKTYSGESAKTSFFMKLGIKSLEQLASSFHKKILNLSNKAAIVNGIEHTNQPELDDETFNLFESLEIQETDAQKHLQLIKIETTKCVQNINQIKELCQKALKLNSVNSTTQNPDTIEKNLVRIDRIEKKLEKKYKIYSDFIKTAVAEDLLKLLRQSDTNNHNHAIKNKWLKDYYNYFFEGTSITLDFLENARIVIESRFLEYESKVNEEALKKSWDKLGIPGRSCIYSANSFHNLVENNINDLCIEHKKMLNPASQIVKKSSEALNTFHETYISFIVHKKLEKI